MGTVRPLDIAFNPWIDYHNARFGSLVNCRSQLRIDELIAKCVPNNYNHLCSLGEIMEVPMESLVWLPFGPRKNRTGWIVYMVLIFVSESSLVSMRGVDHCESIRRITARIGFRVRIEGAHGFYGATGQPIRRAMKLE